MLTRMWKKTKDVEKLEPSCPDRRNVNVLPLWKTDHSFSKR